MRVQVYVRLKEGVLDVQGKAVQNGLAHLGFEGIEHVRIGKLIEMNVKAGSEQEALQKAEEICQKLLINPIIENYEIRSAL